MATLRSVLEEIEAGKTSFAPTSRAEKDMRAFQPTANPCARRFARLPGEVLSTHGK